MDNDVTHLPLSQRLNCLATELLRLDAELNAEPSANIALERGVLEHFKMATDQVRLSVWACLDTLAAASMPEPAECGPSGSRARRAAELLRSLSPEVVENYVSPESRSLLREAQDAAVRLEVAAPDSFDDGCGRQRR
jgi:hypothetical protein